MEGIITKSGSARPSFRPPGEPRPPMPSSSDSANLLGVRGERGDALPGGVGPRADDGREEEGRPGLGAETPGTLYGWKAVAASTPSSRWLALASCRACCSQYGTCGTCSPPRGLGEAESGAEIGL